MKPTFTLHSLETGTTYFLLVEAPGESEGPGPWPVVLFMDGDDQFSTAISAYREARADRSVSPLILVGVGYGASYAKPANKRGRDYTPTPHTDEPTSGGAAPFLDFLTKTLWPALQARYRVDPNRRGIAGHSLGSLLVLHALWRQPPFFSDYLASAPSLWWDNRRILEFARERQADDRPLDARLFLSVGDEDSASMTGDFGLLEQQLEANPIPGLAVTTRRFARRDHFNVLAEAFRIGLATLFPATH